MRKVDPAEVLRDLAVLPDPYAVELVEGVSVQLAAIDDLIASASVDWDLDRMASVDRQVLRLATFELLGEPDVPLAVVIDEAVELVKQFSTEESGGFVNGVLSTVARQVRPLPAD